MNDILVKEFPFEFSGINFLLYQTEQKKLLNSQQIMSVKNPKNALGIGLCIGHSYLNIQ